MDKKRESVFLNGREYELAIGYRDDAALCGRFNDLTRRTFGFDFADWRRDGYWTERYIPYTLFAEGKAVANVSVNRMDFLVDGAPRHYIQLGTVMTDAAYRRRGLARYLMERAIEEWRARCDMLYLFANETALDFYPRFGFRVVDEYACTRRLIAGARPQTRRLDMAKGDDRALAEKTVAAAAPLARLSMRDNLGLTMFYCAGFLRDSLYYVPACEALLVCEEGRVLDVFCADEGRLDEALRAVCDREAHLGFTPFSSARDALDKIIRDDALYALGPDAARFAREKWMFPELSRA